MKPLREYPDPAPDAGFETIAAHFAEVVAEWEGAASPPIYQASTFIYPNAEAFARRRTADSQHHDYSRVSNPTTQVLEAKLARLERGQWAHCFASGMGAISAALNACLETGSHVVSVQHVYGPTRAYLGHMKRFGVDATYVPGVATDDFVRAFRPATKVLYLESPTSGHFECPDVAELVGVAHQRKITVIFDNSWASPYFMNPLELGADIVVHSATKFLNGHSDVVAGVAAGRDTEMLPRIVREAELGGACMDPFAAWLMIRGLRTLAIRMQQHERSGLALANMLCAHPAVARVNHPALATHPQHAIAARQLRGYSGLFSFALKEQSREATFRFLDRLRLFGQGVSWGGYESLAIGGAFFDPAGKEWLIRLHAGLETTEDLLADVDQALR